MYSKETIKKIYSGQSVFNVVEMCMKVENLSLDVTVEHIF